MSETVLAASELARIVASLNPPPTEASSAALALHHQSKARVKQWTNTLEGQRKQLERERESQLARQETKRQEIDVLEAEIQLADRKRVIERANALLASESDRLKTFSSAMMLSDVLKEREQQVLVKHELGQLEKIRDQRYADLNHRNYRQLLERELREKHKLQDAAKTLQSAQRAQLQEAKSRRIEELEEAVEEGELLRRKTEEDLLVELERSLQSKQRAVSNLKQTQKANMYLQQVRARELTHSLQEDARIKTYATEKAEMAELRKRKEKELFDKKQAARNAMIEKQQQALKTRLNHEEDRVNREVKQRDDELEQEHQMKLAKMQRWQHEIDQSRQGQIANKRRAAELAKSEDERNAAQVRELAKRLELDEQDEVNERKSAYRRIAQEQLHQIARKHSQQQQNHTDEQIVVKQAKQALMADMINFHRFAEGAIRDYAGDGKNVIPLIKQLRSHKTGLHN